MLLSTADISQESIGRLAQALQNNSKVNLNGCFVGTAKERVRRIDPNEQPNVERHLLNHVIVEEIYFV